MPIARGLRILMGCLMLAVSAAALGDQVDERSNVDANGNPRTDVIPANNSDLEDFSAKAQAISAFAANCQGMECPIIDCDVAANFQENLYRAEDFLKHLLRWLEKANKAHFDHFMSVSAQSSLTSQRIAEIQEILAYQEYVMGIANGLLDIADITDIFETYAKDPSKLNPENFEELVNHAWRLDKLIKKVESGATNVASGLSGQDVPPAYSTLTPDALGLTGGDWNTVKGYTGEILGMVHETRKGLKAGETLFEAFNKPGGARANLLSALGSVASAWGKADMEERAAFAQQLSLDLAAEDQAAANAFNARRKVLQRIDAAEQALADVQAANSALQACMVKAKCPLRSKTRPGNNLPDFIQIGPTGVQIESWGWALSRLQVELDDVRSRLGPPFPDLEDKCPNEDDTALRLGDLFPGSDYILIGFDSPAWCTYQNGNPGTTSLTPPPEEDDDGDDPRDVPVPPGGGTPPEDGGGDGDGDGDGDDPRDVPKQPCEHELDIINTFLEEHGEGLRAEINDSSLPSILRDTKRKDLETILERKKELEKDCPKGGGGDDGDDPRDVPPVPPIGELDDPCEELRQLRVAVTELGLQMRDSSTSAARKAELEQQIDSLVERIEKLEKECPSNGDDPRDAPGDDGPPEGTPVVTIYVKAKSAVAEGGAPAGQGLGGQQIKLFAPSTQVALPGAGRDKPQIDHDEEPVQGVTDENGNLALGLPAQLLPIGLIGTPAMAGQPPAFAINIDSTTQGSLNVLIGGPNLSSALGVIPTPMMNFLASSQTIGNQLFLTFTYPASMDATMQSTIVHIPGVVWIEINFCRDKQAAPNDPLYSGQGAWEQPYDNQWAIKRVGLDDSRDSAWNLLGKDPSEVVVAVIDTGIDWNHLDMSWENLWNNPLETPDNGIDDDNNGYVDDVIGWDFYGDNNRPWDHDGHGTFVAGVIAADSDNKIGMAGINPHARIMVLKALNSFGHSRASYLAEAITYAADNGARIINLSVGGKNLTRIEKAAIDYARSKDVLIVVASGNEGVDISNFGPAGEAGVLAVGATGLKDEHQPFSNWGANLDIAAPGIEVLGLRARRTDTMRDIPGIDYEAGANYVGEDKRYYRASGTSFAAPIVAGVASLVLSKWPELNADEVRQILLQSAEDVAVGGVDQLTGYGLVDAKAALKSAPGFFITGNIDGVEVVQENGKTLVRVKGSADANELKRAWVELGAGETPDKWKRVSKGFKDARANAALVDIDASNFAGATVWTVRLIVEHKNGQRRESRFVLNLG
ncbi:MAG: S8 family peptidase [Pseudomonadota bacterium]